MNPQKKGTSNETSEGFLISERIAARVPDGRICQGVPCSQTYFSAGAGTEMKMLRKREQEKRKGEKGRSAHTITYIYWLSVAELGEEKTGEIRFVGN